MLQDEAETLYEGDHIQVRFRRVGGGGEGEAGGPPGGEAGTGQALEKMMEMMRLQGEQLQLLAASTSGLRKEVEELKSGKGKEKQREEKEEPIAPISVANVEKMEAAPHPLADPADSFVLVLPAWETGSNESGKRAKRPRPRRRSGPRGSKSAGSRRVEKRPSGRTRTHRTNPARQAPPRTLQVQIHRATPPPTPTVHPTGTGKASHGMVGAEMGR